MLKMQSFPKKPAKNYLKKHVQRAEVHHIHVELGDRVYTIGHDGATVDYDDLMNRLSKIGIDHDLFGSVVH